MTTFQFRPIQQWPRPFTQGRRASTFTADYSSTLQTLTYEIDKLGAMRAVIQVAMGPEDIRQDGLPRASAKKPAHPGVIVSFDSPRTGPVSFPCDAFLDWKDNLRAIALTLERLRLADLYGVTRHAEQYRGWQALPAPGQAPETENDDGLRPGGKFRDAESAARWLSRVSGVAVSSARPDADAVNRAYRKAASELHPDAGGDHEAFVRLQQAAGMLRR
jgi:hypothetical protein